MPKMHTSTTVPLPAPIYYNHHSAIEIHAFKQSADYPQFKKEYQQAIDNIIRFYNQYSPDKGLGIITSEIGLKATVQEMLTQFKLGLFADNVDVTYLHSLYYAKRHMEEIAQLLLAGEGIEKPPVAASSVALEKKLDEICELAKKIKWCGSGVQSYILNTKLSLSTPSGDLLSKMAIIRLKIAHSVVTEFTSGEAIPVYYRASVHTFNFYLDQFNEELNIPPSQDPHTKFMQMDRQNYQACQQALMAAVTPYHLTYQLATHYRAHLRNFLPQNSSDHLQEFGLIRDVVTDMRPGYGEINLSSLIEEAPEGHYQLRKDITLLQVDMAKQLSRLARSLPKSSWPDWSIETLEDDGKGNKIQRIGDLFWQEQQGELNPLDMTHLKQYSHYVDQMASGQLMGILRQASDQDAYWLSQLDPKYLHAAEPKDIALFFSTLGEEESIAYAKRHSGWFKTLAINPLMPVLLKRPGDQLAEIPADLLQAASPSDIALFFLKLGDEGGIDYAQRHIEWFKTLTANPLMPVLLTLPDEKLATISVDLLPAMNTTEIGYFFEQRNNYRAAVYIQNYIIWFNNQYQRISYDAANPWTADDIEPRRLLLEIIIKQSLAAPKSPPISHAGILGNLLICAIEYEDKYMAQLLLQRKEIGLTQSQYGHHENPLFLALRKNQTALIRLLLARHPLADYQDPGRYNVLYHPVAHKNVEILRELLIAGADPNEKNVLTRDLFNTRLLTKTTVLEQAVLSKDSRMVKVLLAYQAKDDSANALMLAIDQGNIEMVKALASLNRPSPSDSAQLNIYQQAIARAQRRPNAAEMIRILQWKKNNLICQRRQLQRYFVIAFFPSMN